MGGQGQNESSDFRFLYSDETGYTDKTGVEALAAGEEGGRAIGEVLDQVDEAERRSYDTWARRIGDVMNVVRSNIEQARTRGDEGAQDQLNRSYGILDSIHQEIQHASQSWIRTAEALEGRQAYVRLQNAIIEGWPRRAVADRLFYLGSGLVGGGGVAYALLGPAGIVDVAALWAAGICSLAISLFFLNKYDEERSAHFADVRKRVR